MIGIISDIHGNYEALSSVLLKFDKMGIDEVVCLGDIAGYYNQINECCETLQERGISSLMGNHDWYLIAGQRCPRSNSANVCLDYQRRVIAKTNLDWLASLPVEMTLCGIRMVHGGWNDPIDEYLTPTQDYFGGLEGHCFASGHTHVPCLWIGGGKTYCNPGSVGQPRDGNPNASFATWDGSSFALHRVEYDIHAMQLAMHAIGFSPHFYKNLEKGVQIGGVSRVDQD